MSPSDSAPDLHARLVSGAELRATVRASTAFQGRLAYGGLQPGLVGCEILDMSEGGIRVSTFARLEPCPELFSVEFNGVYSRARRSWSKGHEIGLEFIVENDHGARAV